MKPQGLPTAELARMCRTFALAGIDIVKDDHGIADQACSPFAERVPACQAAIADAVAATGKPSFYAPHLIGTPRVLRERARIARDAGVRVVLVAPMIVGLPAFADLVDEFPELVYLAHPSFGGAARIAPPLLFGRIFRLLGADAPIFVNYGGRFAYPQEECGALAARRARAVGRDPPGAAGPGGRDAAGPRRRAARLLRPDTMLLIGGNLLLAEGDALLARAREFVAMVDAASATHDFDSSLTRAPGSAAVERDARVRDGLLRQRAPREQRRFGLRAQRRPRRCARRRSALRRRFRSSRTDRSSALAYQLSVVKVVAGAPGPPGAPDRPASPAIASIFAMSAPGFLRASFAWLTAACTRASSASTSRASAYCARRSASLARTRGSRRTTSGWTIVVPAMLKCTM